MRAFFVLIILIAATFVGALYTQLLSYVLLHPYGLHALTYGQALTIDLVFGIGAFISGVFFGVVKAIVD